MDNEQLKKLEETAVKLDKCKDSGLKDSIKKKLEVLKGNKIVKK